MYFLSTTTPLKGKLRKVQLLRKGSWAHPSAPNGKLEMTDPLMDQLVENFNNGILGSELPMNLNHDDRNFTVSRGWIQKLERTADGIDMIVKPTPAIEEKLDSGELKYVSAEINFNYVDHETGKKTPVIRGAAWTNVPYIKKMRPAEVINLADILLAEGIQDGDSDDDLSDRTTEELDTPGIKTIADAKDPDAKDAQLPDQCRSCALLMAGSCPFKGTELKMASAGDGTCPRYEAQDALTFPDPTSTEDPMSKANGGEMTLAELQATVLELSEKVATSEKTATVLSTALEAERAERLRLSDAHRRQMDAVFLSELVNEGKLLPAQTKLAETILNKARGTEGTILLSEVSGSEEVKLSETSLEEDIRTLLSELEPQVLLGEGDTEVVQLSQRGGGDIDGSNFDSAVRSVMTKNPTMSYGEAAREAAKTFRGGKR